MSGIDEGMVRGVMSEIGVSVDSESPLTALIAEMLLRVVLICASDALNVAWGYITLGIGCLHCRSSHQMVLGNVERGSQGWSCQAIRP
jgi:hypothetical protein